VLSGPALMLPPGVSGVERSAAKTFGALTPGLRVQKLDESGFNRDPAARQDLRADPLVDHRNLPAASAAATVKGIDRVQDELEQVRTPFLVMHGTLDPVTNPEGSAELQRRARSADKTLKPWTGAYHDLLHEPEQAQVVEAAVSWIDARLPTTPDTTPAVSATGPGSP
jgi:acylglycerol lipase